MLTRIKIFPVSNYKQDDIYRNKNYSAFLQKKIPGHHHDFPGLENGLTKFHDFPGRVVTLHNPCVTDGQKVPGSTMHCITCSCAVKTWND